MAATDVHPTCWSEGYLRSHCEGYRVDDEADGPIGFVEAVIWPQEPYGGPEAVVVRRIADGRVIVIQLARVTGVEPWLERVLVDAAGPSRSRLEP